MFSFIDFSPRIDYCPVEFKQALRRESNSINAPNSYRDFMTRLVEEYEALENDSNAVDTLSKKNALYSKYVKAAEGNYNYLEELYKEEHKANLDLKDELIQLKLKMKEKEEAYELKEQRMTQQVQQIRSVFTDKFERQKEEYTKTANKQAVGRRSIEEKLMMKEIENNEVKGRLQEVENQLQARVKELEFVKVENSQLKLLATYLQNPQRLSNQPQQIPQPQTPRYQ